MLYVDRDGGGGQWLRTGLVVVNVIPVLIFFPFANLSNVTIKTKYKDSYKNICTLLLKYASLALLCAEWGTAITEAEA